jgi:uncharacterized protein
MPDGDITTRDALKAHYGEPKGHIGSKELPRLTEHCRRFIALSPFVTLASSAAGDGPADCSPRGGEPGFVRILDDTTVALPDRPGNKRTDTFKNVMENANIAMMFLVPGLNEILRINGRARLSTEPALLESMIEKGKPPVAVLVVAIDAVYFHCGKAVVRSDLWNPEKKIGKSAFPTLGRINADTYGVDADEVDRRLAEDYARNLY